MVSDKEKAGYLDSLLSQDLQTDRNQAEEIFEADVYIKIGDLYNAEYDYDEANPNRNFYRLNEEIVEFTYILDGISYSEPLVVESFFLEMGKVSFDVKNPQKAAGTGKEFVYYNDLTNAQSYQTCLVSITEEMYNQNVSGDHGSDNSISGALAQIGAEDESESGEIYYSESWEEYGIYLFINVNRREDGNLDIEGIGVDQDENYIDELCFHETFFYDEMSFYVTDGNKYVLDLQEDYIEIVQDWEQTESELNFTGTFYVLE